MGRSKQGKTLRYLKQTKARNAELPDDPLIMELVKANDGLRFEYRGYEPEAEHLVQLQIN
jgi:hypothetical protein